MHSLTKITTNYIETEDRFRIIGSASESNDLCFWISQRLLLRLLPPILKWTDENQLKNIQSDGASKSSINEFALQEARQRFAHESRPKDAPNSPTELLSTSLLLQEVDLKFFAQNIQLCLKHNGKNIASLSLTKLEARQWILIVHAQWTRSGWPMSLWPDWLTQPSLLSATEMH